MRIDAAPIWVLFIGTIIALTIAIEVGYRLGRAAHQRSDDEKESPASAIAGAVLGLAAFMLAFAFGIVMERHDAKKALVRDDAIAIRTAWRRTAFLPDSDRAEARSLLRQYVDARLAFVQAGNLEAERAKRALSESQRIQDRLWDMSIVNAGKGLTPSTAMYINSLDEVNAVHVMRVAVGIQSPVPIEIWFVLCAITVLGMIGVGYQTGIAGSKRSMVRPLLALAFALVIALIASLDRPDSGVMKVTQQPLLDLQSRMK